MSARLHIRWPPPHRSSGRCRSRSTASSGSRPPRPPRIRWTTAPPSCSGTTSNAPPTRSAPTVRATRVPSAPSRAIGAISKPISSRRSACHRIRFHTRALESRRCCRRTTMRASSSQPGAPARSSPAVRRIRSCRSQKHRARRSASCCRPSHIRVDGRSRAAARSRSPMRSPRISARSAARSSPARRSNDTSSFRRRSTSCSTPRRARWRALWARACRGATRRSSSATHRAPACSKSIGPSTRRFRGGRASVSRRRPFMLAERSTSSPHRRPLRGAASAPSVRSCSSRSPVFSTRVARPRENTRRGDTATCRMGRRLI